MSKFNITLNKEGNKIGQNLIVIKDDKYCAIKLPEEYNNIQGVIKNINWLINKLEGNE